MSVLTPLLRENPFSKIALIGFLLTLPLSVRKVLWVFSPQGLTGFNEYTDVSLYLSDLTLGVFIFFVVLENKKRVLSIIWWKQMFHVERSERQEQNVPRGTLVKKYLLLFQKCSTWNIFPTLVLAPVPFLVWSALSIFWSESDILSFQASIRLFEAYFLYLGIIILNVPRGTYETNPSIFEKCSTWNIVKNIRKMFHVEHLPADTSGEDLTSKNVPRGTSENFFEMVLKKCSTWNIYDLVFRTLIFSGFLHSILSISQFMAQSSLGISFLKESELSVSGAGIAKFLYADTILIRSYGLFPHPNILAAFLGITIILTISYQFVFGRRMFHVEHFNESIPKNVPRGTLTPFLLSLLNKCSTWNIVKNIRKMFHVEHFDPIYGFILFTQLLGFLFAFSKAAILGLIIGVSFFIYRMFHVEHCEKQLPNVPRGTFSNPIHLFLKKCSTWNIVKNIRKMFHVEHSRKIVKLAIILGIILFTGSQLNWYYFFEQPIQERFSLYKSFFSVMSQYPWQGTGIGQFVLTLNQFSSGIREAWQWQPIHSLFLLITAELGLIGLLLFSSFLFVLFKQLFFLKNVPRGTLLKSDSGCSARNTSIDQSRKMFHVEHPYQSTPRGPALAIIFASIALFLFVTSLFDHYYWDIQQGILLFWLFLALTAGQGIARKYYIDK